MSLLDEMKRVALADQRKICLRDEDDISLAIGYGGETEHTFPVPYPNAGYGGGFLLLSPSEKYLLFSYYSGQSEEAFMLLKINGDSNPALALVYASGYLYGEAASYCFSKNETLLIQGLPNLCGVWDWKDYMDQGFAEQDDAGGVFFVYGRIHVLDIAKREMREHVIRVYPSEGSENFPEDNDALFMSPHMIQDDLLEITMPWGKERLAFPPDEVIVFHLK